METTTCSIIVFVKWPEKGKVKTRLTAAYGEDAATELYKCFVEDILRTVRGEGFRPLIAYYPPDAGGKIAAWLGDGNDYMPQSGRDLGERMKNAFRQLFEKGKERAVLIGSDFPDLPAEIITEAFSRLERSQAVIGPAKDGGYYLLGFRRDAFVPLIFEGIPWSTSGVFERTMAILAEAGPDVHTLPVWHDIDRPEDLIGFISRNIGKPFEMSKTMGYMQGKLSLGDSH